MSYIIGTYTKDIFVNSSNGYIVGNMKIKESDLDNCPSSLLFVGLFSELRLRSDYKMVGELVKHPKYGSQFQVASYEVVLPTKSEELIEFLSSELFPIGEKMAFNIVSMFGEETLEVILERPNDLLMIPRLSQERIEKIHDILNEYKYSSQIVIDLSSLGFSTKQALAIYKKYESNSLEKVKENIYDFIDDLAFNFKDVDVIACNMGMDDLDERRLEALVIHMFHDLTFNSGATYLEFEMLYQALIQDVKDLSGDMIEYILLKLNSKGKVIIKDDRYYLKEFYDAEEYIVDRLAFLNDMETRKLPKLLDKVTELEKKNDILYDDTQKEAIVKAINNNLVIITGGPGTGKTTIIKAIVSLLRIVYKARDEEIALLAPTGRAAKRMMETTGISSYTIHRYLCWDKDNDVFQVNEYNPRGEKYIIVDEASMLDTVMTASLLKGIRRDAKVVLVGDYYQLPSVAQGQVLKDLIDSEMLDVVHLNCLYRQNEESYIPTLASEIKDKELSSSFIMKKDDYNFVECPNEQVLMTIENIVTRAVKKGYTDREIQILAPMYKSLNGIDNLNKVLQALFNPKEPEKNEIVSGDVVYRVGDKVLQLVNDPDNSVYNGDIGYIIEIKSARVTESKKMELVISFDDNLVNYTLDKLVNIRHGYAISVHKAQGSEFPMVIMPIVNSFNRMLYNKLIYTAVTRAKKSLILVGDRSAFLGGVRNDYFDNRKTTLKSMLEDKYNSV